MPDAIGRVPTAALPDVAFLARSENRLGILVALDAGPATRRELEEATGVARATVGRALSDFEDRGWVVESTGREYATTPAGARILGEFVPFMAAMEAVRRLGDRVAWLPTDEVPIELGRFADATVRRPERADPLSPAMSLAALLREASEFHCLVGVAPPLQFEQVMRDRVVTGDLLTRHVITTEELSYLRRDGERLTRWHEYVDAGGNVYCHDGEIPCNLLVFDGTVVVGPHPREGEPTGLVESEDEAVLAWAHELISRYQRASDRLTPAQLDG